MSVIINKSQIHSVRSCCDYVQRTLGTRHTDRADMQFKVVFLVALISVTINLIIYIYLPKAELFHSDCFSELPL